ncbi:hypothetical protein A2130_01910 [Candidatus Woesebacteria bacterium GWC2_33_12]|uniref:Uncharacterized protein n=1 Tax=Candidatus Woesebacteria bacterium GW2011_GWB1_33_22 TaxID=1618566 RepID=A0A0G0A1F6_9BACT|nr:MAG: hypothetical protein UR29_C0003G0014 [Candidatus Woesebacteria bacterium GW2011_GWC2_33_12]KKP42255.1 MAG: hypothetical protein UR33_C0004G0014 [Candidatus Woesebacteria bacterium GW2011_GWA2_33_20]KKP44986.1 MAG: hypothetical protein UR35_C0004G0018 [Candidatus Woesebacteria bacterium GW2011_GWB1_33_22]KKP46835.1 MAG: hypothetical protein UR37_C0004G0014 [Microgenomates group bacterium GW2011_GWC1_33_28]KKP50707.1 MAG: hypothetical protein UR41_C0004G0018 [Candidatus Woesebacteria bact
MNNKTQDNDDMRDTLHPVFSISEIKSVKEISEEYYKDYREYWDSTLDSIHKMTNKLKTDKKYKINEEENEILKKRFELSCNWEHKQKEISYMIETNINFLNGKTKGSLYDIVCNAIYPDFTTSKEIDKRVNDWLKGQLL